MPTPSDVPTHGILCSPMGVFRGTDGLRCYSPGQAIRATTRDCPNMGLPQHRAQRFAGVSLNVMAVKNDDLLV